MRTTTAWRDWPSVTIARALASLTVVAAALLVAPAAHAVTPGELPGASQAQQVIVVSSTDFHSTRARLSAYEKSSDGTWVSIVTNVPAFVGARGIVPGASRRQSTNTTPAGTYAITSAFGRRANPGTTLPYVQVDRNDAWTYNPDLNGWFHPQHLAERRYLDDGTYEVWHMGLRTEVGTWTAVA